MLLSILVTKIYQMPLHLNLLLKETNAARLQNIACQSMGVMFMLQHMLIVEPVNTILVEFLSGHLGQRQWSLEEWH